VELVPAEDQVGPEFFGVQPGPTARTELSRPEWFASFLADRGTRKRSTHTMKAYRQDFDAIAALIVGTDGDLSAIWLGHITTEAMRVAFAQFAETHEAASIQRCWSTWNVLCTFLYTSELIAANPMQLVSHPKIAKTLPKGLPPDSVQALLAAIDSESERRASDWVERDRALILTSLLAGLRADELLRANVGDVRRRDYGAVIHVRGKGGKDRRIPIEMALVEILEDYLDSRAVRFPTATKSAPPPAGDLTGGCRQRRCSSDPMATGSPAAHCNTECCGPSGEPESTESGRVVHSCTDCDTLSPRSWPTPMSTFTR
jgi:site-specific recombinase XerC